MAGASEALRYFLETHPACALVEVIEARGSTPREQGAWMLVAPSAIFGTIGGGQLEWMAIDEGRALLPGSGTSLAELAVRFPVQEEMLQERGSPSPSRLCRSTSPPSGGRGKPKLEEGTSLPLPPEGGEVAAEGRRRGGTTFPQASDPCKSAQSGIAPRLTVLDIPLGPEIGQCCGGRVRLRVRLVDDELREALLREAQAEEAALPQVLVFGAGHVGHALAAALALLPVRATVVETRGAALDGLASGVQGRLTPIPEEAVRAAPPGAAFVILTHDHALDFLLAAEALRRNDAAYVGMIGSKTKRATFRRWFSEAGGTEAQFARLVCPIGGSAVRDKRPAVIAALAAAEIASVLFGQGDAAAADHAKRRARTE